MSFGGNENNLKLNNRMNLITPKYNYYKNLNKTITVEMKIEKTILALKNKSILLKNMLKVGVGI